MRTNAPTDFGSQTAHFLKLIFVIMPKFYYLFLSFFCRELGFIWLSVIHVWLEALICLGLWLFYRGKKTETGKHIAIGSIYNVSNCKHFIGNGCVETSFNFLRCFYCLLKTGCRNFTDSSGVYIYCSNPYCLRFI